MRKSLPYTDAGEWPLILPGFFLRRCKLANMEEEELAEARALIRDAMERVEIVRATYRYKYTPENHTGLTEPCETLVVREGRVSLLEWEDMKNDLYFPEGYDGLVGI